VCAGPVCPAGECVAFESILIGKQPELCLIVTCYFADFVCPAGEYVAVEYIESILGKNEMVEQIWVYGSSFESVLVAVVVPNKGPLMRWAKEQVRQWL
jgi:hypothetical protein